MDRYPGPGTCSLMPSVWVPGTCAWCADPLPKGRRRWCGDGHLREYQENHDWNMARSRRLRDDQRICQSCGILTLDVTNERSGPGYPAAPMFVPFSDPGYEEFRKARREFDVALRQWRKTVMLPRAPEVNHIEPRVGRGYGFGCWNHQSNLETLCHRCHVGITKRQRAERRLAEAQRIAQMQLALEAR